MGRNIKGMSFSRLMATVLFVSRLSIMTAREQTELNQSFLALLLKKVCGMYDSISRTISSAMRLVQREGSLTWKQ